MIIAELPCNAVKLFTYYSEKLNKKHKVKLFFKTKKIHHIFVCIMKCRCGDNNSDHLIFMESYSQFKKFYNLPNKGFYFLDPNAIHLSLQ